MPDLEILTAKTVFAQYWHELKLQARSMLHLSTITIETYPEGPETAENLGGRRVTTVNVKRKK